MDLKDIEKTPLRFGEEVKFEFLCSEKVVEWVGDLLKLLFEYEFYALID